MGHSAQESLQIDRDRIIYSPHLASGAGCKITQVRSVDGFLVHNRGLTHSLKVAQLTAETAG